MRFQFPVLCFGRQARGSAERRPANRRRRHRRLNWQPVVGAAAEAAAEGPTIRPRHAIKLAASTIENDTFIVSLGQSISGSFDRLVAFRDDVRLADEVMQNELENLPRNAGPTIIFDTSGLIYGLTDGAQGALVQSVSLGPTGLSAGPFFEVAGTEAGTGPVDVAQSEVFTPLGTVIDLVNQTADARYDTRAPSFDDSRGGIAVNADVASGDVYILVGANIGGLGVGRYDYASGTLSSEQELSEFPQRSPSVFDIDPSSLGITLGGKGLVIIDKDHLH